MLTTLLFDLDETLCDTTGANNKALKVMAQKCMQIFPDQCTEDKADDFSQRYLKGIYREFDAREEKRFLPITHEKQFRLQLIAYILNDLSIRNHNPETALMLQESFDDARTQFFDFFPGIEMWLQELRNHFTIGVITNGPEFSQKVKVERVNLKERVDFFIIGGQEPEQKPAKSIFDKALLLAGAEKNQALHIGDSLSADIQGANNAGIDSIWISHGLDYPDACEAKPSHIIESPFQLPDLIRQLHLDA